MELASKYNPAEVESKWYKYWMDNNLFASKPDGREPYCIVIPPPNVTGVLHMGHMLNNTIQDILVRRARMLGKNACWVPGTDHASIATEAKVVNKLAAEGIKKTDLSREEFLKHAWEWTDKHGGIILEQLKKLGASCDWDRTCFTMDAVRSESVLKVFVDLFEKGLIYRGVRMVNWDPKALTALSDEEVIFKEQQGKLYYLRYKIVGEEGYAVVATTRPETILGDTAMCINPNDEKNAHLRGKKVLVPLVNREIPVIQDEYVDVEFGTGCLKVTPAHDVNDYMLGEKYNLETIDIFNDNGTLNDHGAQYAGLDRFDVRKQIEKDLVEADLMEKVEAYTNKVGFSERTDVPIEPKLSMQWFLKMEQLAKPALDSVMNDDIKLVPAKFKNTYRHWMENVKDWCISRQLWWGHRIPAYFLPQGGYVVAETPEQALEIARQKSGDANLQLSDLRQDEDCLDTWFSSWLWPISVFDGINNPENEEIKYYYPTNDLVTGPDILFFWVARMIISGYEYRNEMPFENVYLTGIVRDKLGRKMSKSLGNSPEPLALIETFGADGVRMGMMLAAPAGNDIHFDEALCEQGRNFNNKIWNAFRLVKGWEVDETLSQPESAAIAIKWFDALLNRTIADVNDSMDKYRISEALMEIYKLFWDEFSSWYLEMVKPAYQQPIDKATYEATLGFFDALLKLLHPYMPFITEELWQATYERAEGESLMTQLLPEAKSFDASLIEEVEIAKEIITGVRNVRAQKNIPNKEAVLLEILGEHNANNNPLILKLSNLSGLNVVSEKSTGAVSFLVGTSEYAVPLGNLLNVEEELKKLNEELIYQQGFLVSVQRKLSNEKFVANAKPEVVDAERKKQSDAESKIKSIEESIASLKK
ncbi:MAG: valine--tRNA ligase [Bacteroidales bacterium]|nr:valine--tRNA ligase [Bacteroidales bacterium]